MDLVRSLKLGCLSVIGYQVMIAVKLDQPVAAAGSTFQRHGA
jgi:hypothetical protein